jgi:hypothetical protein
VDLQSCIGYMIIKKDQEYFTSMTHMDTMTSSTQQSTQILEIQWNDQSTRQGVRGHTTTTNNDSDEALKVGCTSNDDCTNSKGKYSFIVTSYHVHAIFVEKMVGGPRNHMEILQKKRVERKLEEINK